MLGVYLYEMVLSSISINTYVRIHFLAFRRASFLEIIICVSQDSGLNVLVFIVSSRNQREDTL